MEKKQMHAWFLVCRGIRHHLFVVLLVGFAYEWRTGALDWVRAVSKPATASPAEPTSLPRGSPQESVLSA